MSYLLRQVFRLLFSRRPVPAASATQDSPANADARARGAALHAYLTASPSNSVAWFKLGNRLKALGEPEKALACYQSAVDLLPDYGAALCNRGAVLLELGRVDEAIQNLRLAVASDPTDALAHYNLALAFEISQQKDYAMETYRKAIELRPDYIDALLRLSGMLAETGLWSEVVLVQDMLLRVQAGNSQAHFRRAHALAKQRLWGESLLSYDMAVRSDPELIIAHLQRGNVLREMQRWADALDSYDRVIALAPTQHEGYFNRGVLYEQLGRLPDALSSYESAIDVQPDFAPAQHNRSLVQLLGGDLLSGFANYEWRWKNRDTAFDPASYHGCAPLWLGEGSLEDKRVLVFSEQGLGDTIQFSRYLRLLDERGAKVAFEVQQPLLQLMKSVSGVGRIFPRGGIPPEFDYKVPLMSLPFALKTTLDSIPSEAKYLYADPAKVEEWLLRLGPKPRPRVGLVWSGNADFPNDRFRSLPLAIVTKHLPLGIDYFCLQRDVRDSDRMTLEQVGMVKNYSPDLDDTAALCECMDLVVTVCTSIAHLAGALGRPVWIMLASNPDWRWFLNRCDSPWYPSAKLYRQQKFGDWDGVAKEIARDLQATFGL
jgi:tetratricopeptide (TPR) repeat protein